MGDAEVEDDARPAALDPHGADEAIDDCRLRPSGAPGECAGHRERSTHLPLQAASPPLHDGAIGAQDDIRIKQRQQRVEVAIARRGQKCVDHRSLAREVGLDVVV
jgi:hypothetical protein